MRYAVVVAVAGLAALTGCSRSSGSGGAPSASASAAAIAAPPAPPPPPKKTPVDEIQALGTLQEAIAYAKPEMQEAFGKTSAGTMLLAAWGTKHMTWQDVAVAKDETTPALVMKDPDEERGKRACFTGKIIQIEVEKLSIGKVTAGLLMVGYYNTTLFHFINVGSSGTLVENNQARLCGVVTGKYDYSNSGGGTGHAIEIVGMWDLPENKPDAGKK